MTGYIRKKCGDYLHTFKIIIESYSCVRHPSNILATKVIQALVESVFYAKHKGKV